MPELNTETQDFVASLKVADDFSQALSQKDYVPVPPDWLVAVTDVVKSRQAIKEGRFKSVNMAGVAMISAAMNALGHQNIPYIFGGDGAALVCAPADERAVKEALSQTIAWAEDELGLELRAAVMPVSDVEAAGHQVLIDAVRVSTDIVNFAFTGGGISAAEKMMKQGDYRIPRAEGANYPDLSGLSCRWSLTGVTGKRIISLILEPWDEAVAIPFTTLQHVMDLVQEEGVTNHPVPEEALSVAWPPAGLALEARATRKGGSLFRAKLRALYIAVFLWVLNKTGWKFGEFDPVHYRETMALNTDYQKIQDGVRMTVSLTAGKVEELLSYLEDQHARQGLHYGMHEQDSALLTCYVPSTTADNHFHFLDGAGGGYAAAADAMK